MALMKSWLTDIACAIFALCLIASAIAFNLEAFAVSLIFFAGVLISAAVLILLNKKNPSVRK
ncbi:MAG: hypothetical protein K6E26_04870 [Clostridiales bacterium]|nr:hypothetical protein [Clostridiales bacterium]MCR5274676.1 hypothetical protein [Clostridiales bacterium]